MEFRTDVSWYELDVASVQGQGHQIVCAGEVWELHLVPGLGQDPGGTSENSGSVMEMGICGGYKNTLYGLNDGGCVTYCDVFVTYYLGQKTWGLLTCGV